MIKLNITRESIARHRTINLLPWPRTAGGPKFWRQLLRLDYR